MTELTTKASPAATHFIQNSDGATVGLTVDTFRGIRPSFFLRQIHWAGVDFAEVTVAIFNELEKVSRIARKVHLGLHLPIIPHEGFDFACVDRAKEIDALIQTINSAGKKLGLRYVLAHPTESHLYDAPGKVSEEFLFENLSRLELPVILENTIESDSRQFDAFLERAVNRLGDRYAGICFDGPHAFISRRDWFDMLRRLMPEIRVFHFSDCTEEKDLHQPFGLEGHFPIVRVLEFLREQRFSGIVNLELLPQSLNDLGPLFHSYLLILRYLNPKKFRRMRLKGFFFLPLLRMRIRRPA
jgi:hypothetical protein